MRSCNYAMPGRGPRTTLHKQTEVEVHNHHAVILAPGVCLYRPAETLRSAGKELDHAVDKFGNLGTSPTSESLGTLPHLSRRLTQIQNCTGLDNR